MDGRVAGMPFPRNPHGRWLKYAEVALDSGDVDSKVLAAIRERNPWEKSAPASRKYGAGNYRCFLPTAI